MAIDFRVSLINLVEIDRAYRLCIVKVSGICSNLHLNVVSEFDAVQKCSILSLGSL